jgi:hypothetical protein
MGSRARFGQTLVALVLAAALGAMFWIPAMPTGRGWFPVPLDDVYIHFDYAKSFGQGHPFEWIAGQGYSSGETAPLYAVVLGFGWLFGFRGPLLGVWAALIAVVSVASLLLSLRRLRVPWLAALIPFSIGLVDWSIFSGMELALFAAALGRTLEALARTRERHRERAQWRLGYWGIALVLLRPESVVLIAVLAVMAARGAGRRSGFLALARASVPGALATAAIAILNRWQTHDYRSAGAALKLLSSNPYLSDVDRARVYVENLIAFWLKALRGELAVLPALVFVLPLVAVLGLFTRRRALVAACIFSAFLWTLLVTWNGNAPYHNSRYYVPALLLVGIAASLSLAQLPRAAATIGALALIGLSGAKIPGQVRYFVDCCRNIRDQHVEVGLRLARLPDVRLVLLGDAGAIPYVSGVHAMDALGLGGGHVRLVDAAVQGEASVIEEIEALDPGSRPSHLALYPNWFANLSTRFGQEIDRVTVANNVIGGGPTKVIYRARWNGLDGAPSNDRIWEEVDVAYLASEEHAHYLSPQPHGGWTTLDVRKDETGEARFDGGRIIPEGASESFVFARADTHGPYEIRMRVDDAARGITLHGPRGVVGELELSPPIADTWRIAKIRVPHLVAGERLTFEAHGGAYRDHHIWVVRSTE